ncbi:hypothetical protein [Alteraurantiacibacter buctensis]|uniref:Uncharacterized protein n=1 Tax=Alteraurantiacibacter buctensis TaxID=1503981 RepID=A0A844YWK9_9SPHN|nr:hypothetical protein [Alteraurantiacibacter buctensis]MXO71436.1 hypothetical protein [Alteraurantiacibacter buctensis]
MSIRFAAATRTPGPRMRPLQVRALARRQAANDNTLHQIRSAVLHAALGHFALHGLAAPRIAAELACAARVAGDADGHAWWLDICRTLDRRLAARIEKDAANGL